MANFALSDPLLDLTERALSMCGNDPKKVGHALSSIRIGLTLGWIIAGEKDPKRRENGMTKLNTLLSDPDLKQQQIQGYTEELYEMNYTVEERKLFVIMSGEFRKVVLDAAVLVYGDPELKDELDAISVIDNENEEIKKGKYTAEREKRIIKSTREQREDVDRFEWMIRRITTRPKEELKQAIKQAEEKGLKQKDIPPYYKGIPPIFGNELLTWGPARERR